MVKTAVAFHVFYDDIALEILGLLQNVDADFDVFVTTPRLLRERLKAEFRRLGRRVKVIECQNAGQDVAPFLATIPMLVDGGYEAVCKLHTKRGVGELGEQWRRIACGAVIGDDARVKEIQRLFQADKTLAIVGSEELYMSAEAHMYGNRDNVVEVVRAGYPDYRVDSDWGFFAGSVFWLRPELFSVLARVAAGMRFEVAKIERDGQLPHAFERVFGLVPVMHGMTVGLITSGRGADIRVTRAPGIPSRSATTQTIRRLSRSSQLSPGLLDVLRKENPLVHYIRHGERQGYKPNAIFDPQWYLKKNPDVRAGRMGALRHFMRFGAIENRDPGPDFDTAFYLAENADVKQAGIPPARHYLQYGKSEGRRPTPRCGKNVPASGAKAARWKTDDDGVRKTRGRATRRDPAREAVLVVGHWSEPGPLFGAERSLLDVIRALDRLGYGVHAVFPHFNGDYFEGLLDHVHSLTVFEYRWWDSGKPLDDRAVVRFMRIMHEHDIRLVHVNTVMLREPLAAARRLEIASVTHAREVISADPDLISSIGLDGGDIVRQVRERTDFLIANSDAVLQCFDYRKGEAFKVYNGVDVDGLDILNPVAERGIRVGLISSNIPKKGLADFVRLAELAQRAGLPARFVLIGPDNPFVRGLAKLAGLKRLPDNLEIAGYAADPRAALEQVNVVVNFSHFAESFGRTVAEAMAARRPVIVYDYGALPELVRDGTDGFVVPYRNHERALDAIRHLCTRPSLIAEMGERARARAVESFSLESMTASLGSSYRHILKAAQARAAPAGGLRVGYFLWHFPVPSETFVLNELRALKERGVDVKVFCRFSPHADFKPDFAIEWQQVETPDRLAEALATTRRNIVHTHFTYPTVTTFIWPACERIGIDFTFSAHAQDIFRYENDRKNRIGEIGRSPFCRKIFVPGRFHRDYLIERGVPPSKLMINPQLSDAPLLCLRPEARSIGTRYDHRSICAVQRFVEKKGLHHLVEAAPGLKKLGVTVNIYGYGPQAAELGSRIKKLASENVRLCGPVKSREELLRIFAQHDLLVAPSVRAADGDMDGVPTVLFEAMGTGLPVLSSSVASIPDLISDGVNGILFDPGRSESIVAAVERFYRMPRGRVRAMAENAAATIHARYAPERLLSNLIRHWRKETIDIVIVSWNNLVELEHVVDRLFKYTSLPFHLIVCDNHSEAEVVEYLENLADRHSNVTVIRKGYNSFVGPGTNTAIDAGSSAYVIYVCGKEGYAINFGWEIALVDHMDRNQSVGLAGTLCHNPTYLTGQQLAANHPRFSDFRNRDFAAKNPARVFRHVQGGLFILRRTMFDAIGGYSEAVPHDHTDTEYSYYAESCGWQLGSVPGILSLYKTTLPGVMSRLDENVLAVHPCEPAMSEMLDEIARGALALCNVCGWKGAAFVGEEGGETCPSCGSGPSHRTIYRYLAQSMLTHRRLAGLYVDPHPSLAVLWRQQFSGEIVTSRELGTMMQRPRHTSGAGDVDVICVGSDTGDPARLRYLAYRLKPDGVLLLGEAVNDMGVALEEQADALAAAGLRIESRIRYASAVVRFDWRAVLACRFRGISSSSASASGEHAR